MTKAELIEAIQAHDTTLTKRDIGNILEFIAIVVKDELADGGDVTLPGLGKFSVGERAERQGRNPQTGEPMTIAAARVPKFKALKAFKDGIV